MTCGLTILAGFKDAIALQDACNVTGVLHSMPEIATAISMDLERFGWGSTTSRNFHPLAVLCASKLHDMAGLGLDDLGRFGLAYDLAKSVAEGVIDLKSETYKEALREYLVEYLNAGQAGVGA